MTNFGATARGFESPLELLAGEAEAKKEHFFARLDAVLGRMFSLSVQGVRLVEVERSEYKAQALKLKRLTKAHREFIREEFSLTAQQRRGAWFLKDELKIPSGLVNLPATFDRFPRFALGLAADETDRVPTSATPDGLFTWSVLEPMCSSFFGPIMWRRRPADDDEAERQAWRDYEELLMRLALPRPDGLDRMSYGGGWGRLTTEQMLDVRGRFLASFSSWDAIDAARKFRAWRVFALVKHYFNKWKRTPARRRAVITAKYRQHLVGYFGGDWLRFLEYVESQPHPDEVVATSLPEPRVHISGKEKAPEVAKREGLPLKDVQAILASLWGASGESPVHQRVQAMRRFWTAFDEIHAKQQRGAKSLWGLVDDGTLSFAHEGGYQLELYRELLPRDAVKGVDELWSGVLLARWPDRIVGEPFPHAAMARAWGPALKLWHGCALTSWFICEGPSSRTDLKGMAHYYRRERAALAKAGFSVQDRLFEDLVAAESRLGPPEEIRNPAEGAGAPGIFVSITTGTRRAGFEILRNIVTGHRRQWAEEHLDAYLRWRWESEIRGAAEAFNRHVADKGRTPTLKQFVRKALEATNNWFGGNVRGVYTAIGESCSIQPQQVPGMPKDRVTFARLVFEFLCRLPTKDGLEADSHRWEASALAGQSLRYVQLEQALGRPPSREEFGEGTLQRSERFLPGSLAERWQAFVEVIDRARAISGVR